MASFQDILNQQQGTIEPPKPLPVGTYLCVVDGIPEITKIGKNQTDAVVFKLKPMQPRDDVDQEALQNALTVNGTPVALSEKSIRHTLFGTEAAIWRLQEFLQHCDLPDGVPLGQNLNSAMGKQVLVTLGHRASDDGKQIFAEVKATAKV